MNTIVRARFWGFHPRIFREAFRQLKTIGILSTVILALEAILLPVGTAISLSAGEHASRQLVTLLDVHPLLVLVILLAPVMVLQLFNFLNRRKSSDFYHALPIGRSTLFISLFAAVFAWVLLMTVCSVSLSLIVCHFFPELLQVSYGSILPLMTAVLSGALLLAGCAAVAVCITGTVFSNLLVAGLLFFVPRSLMLFVSGMVSNLVNIMPPTFNNPFLDISYNIPYAMVTTVLFGGAKSALLLDNWMGCLYTAVVGFLLFLLANLLFRVRKSEAAGQSASTPFLQAVYRLLVTFLMSLLPVSFLIDGLIGGTPMDGETWFLILVLYIITAVAFCIYELLTTRKPRRLLKVAPSFLLVVAADVALLVGMAVGKQTLLSWQPSAEEIKEVAFGSAELEKNYFSARSEEVFISDPEIVRIVSDRLHKAASANRTDGGMSAAQSNNAWEYVVSIRTDKLPQKRKLSFTDEQTKDIVNALAAIPEYQTAYTLPSPGNGVSAGCMYLTQQQTDEVYRLMVRDINALPFETRYALLENQSYEGGLHAEDLYLNIDYRASIYRFAVPLIDTLTPNAYARYVSYCFENSAKSRDTIRSLLHDMTLQQDKVFDVYCQVFDPQTTNEFYLNQASLNTVKMMERGLLDQTATAKQPFCRVSISYPGDDGEWVQHGACFTLTDELFEMLYELCVVSTKG